MLLALDNVSPAASLSDYLNGNSPKGRVITAAIGSERGWSQTERALLEEKGFTRLGMGGRIMRTETAATVSASIILSQAGLLS
jgi:RNA methyltransferase, RsmE family